jgi:phosphatidylglycerol:prolipoprotein diacylglycerol transferase
VESKIIYNLVIISILAGVIGARLFYVARFPDAFLSKPASIISLNPSLLDLWGGMFTASMVALIYGSRMGLSFWLCPRISPGDLNYGGFIVTRHKSMNLLPLQ